MGTVIYYQMLNTLVFNFNKGYFLEFCPSYHNEGEF